MSERTDACVLCGASAYDEKYYFNQQFSRLPESIKEELRVICVLFTEEIGGQFFMEFDSEHRLMLRTQSAASDYSYDEIGAALMVRQIQRNRQELLASLELFYRVMILGEQVDLGQES